MWMPKYGHVCTSIPHVRVRRLKLLLPTPIIRTGATSFVTTTIVSKHSLPRPCGKNSMREFHFLSLDFDFDDSVVVGEAKTASNLNRAVENHIARLKVG